MVDKVTPGQGLLRVLGFPSVGIIAATHHIRVSYYRRPKVVYDLQRHYPFKDEAKTALFKDPVRTAQ